MTYLNYLAVSSQDPLGVGQCCGSYFTERKTECSQAQNMAQDWVLLVLWSLWSYLQHTTVKKTEGDGQEEKKRKKERNACQNPDISDSKARSLGPSGPMSGTSCLLPTLMASPGWELPHVAAWTHSSNSAASASNHIWLSWNQKDIWGQVIFICTKCLLGTLQEMVPHGTNRHDVTHTCLVVHMETLVSTWKH